MAEFAYHDPIPLGPATTKYRLLTKEHVAVAGFDGEEILKVDPRALELVAREALREVSFLLRPAHLEKVAAILSDPEASANDRNVALAMLRNAEIIFSSAYPRC